MIKLLFSLLFAEAILVLLLLIKTPVRKIVTDILDRAKRGRGPVVAKTVAGTVFVVMVSSVYSMVDIQNRSAESGVLSPTDQVLMGQNLLEASLMGYALFLGLIIDRLHFYIKELRMMRNSIEAAKKQSRRSEDTKGGSLEEMKALEEETMSLRLKVKQLESEAVRREKEFKAA